MLTPIYLASASPRRKMLLQQLNFKFEQFSVDADESLNDFQSAEENVERLACLKAKMGVELGYFDRPVLAADTIVVLEKEILGKPKSKSDAIQMLTKLSGKTHQVMTAIAVASHDKMMSDVVITDVTFKAINMNEIENYWLTGEPLDKAGSYAIQGIAGSFVTKINGSYFAVVGLPLFETKQLLDRFMGKCHE